MTGYLRRIWRSHVSQSIDPKHQETPQYYLPELTFSSPQLLPAKQCDYFLPELKFSSFDSLLFEECLEEGKVKKHEKIEILTHIDNSTFDLDLITFSGPDDPLNPLNWTVGRKWTATLIVSGFTFTSSLASTMVAPALHAISDDLSIVSFVQQMLILSSFMIAYAVGPLFLGPLSEIFGRVPVLRWSNFLFLIFNTASGSVTDRDSMIALRFLSGFCACAPQTIGSGVLSDCWQAEQRGKATAIFSLAPYLGPVAGPILGGLIVESISWRFIFWIISIAHVVLQIVGLIFHHESYVPKILADEVRRLKSRTGNSNLHTKWMTRNASILSTLWLNIKRPFIMLTTQPAIQAIGLYRAYFYGVKYLMLSAFPLVWEGVYKMSTGHASLNYLSIGVGFVVAMQICARYMDKIYCAMERCSSTLGQPEFRVPLMIPGGLLSGIGLLIYGFTAKADIHWIVPNLGAVMFSAGAMFAFQCGQAYIIDAYPRYTASATGAAAFLRAIGGVFPLLAPKMYEKLGVQWANGSLGLLSLAVGIVAPLLLWKYGVGLRGRSKYCAG